GMSSPLARGVPHEQVLRGGTLTHVVRVADTVRRETGSWSPAVHALLRHLEAAGFTGAPRALGIDRRGREVLSYVPGECGRYPLRKHWTTEGTLIAVGEALRVFHDAQQGFHVPEKARWQRWGPMPPDADVICHNDVAPHNVVWGRDGSLSLIDFDLASPG